MAKKTRKRTTQTIAKRFAFDANAKMYSASCADIDHDVTTFEVDGMV